MKTTPTKATSEDKPIVCTSPRLLQQCASWIAIFTLYHQITPVNLYDTCFQTWQPYSFYKSKCTHYKLFVQMHYLHSRFPCGEQQFPCLTIEVLAVRAHVIPVLERAECEEVRRAVNLVVELLRVRQQEVVLHVCIVTNAHEVVVPGAL